MISCLTASLLQWTWNWLLWEGDYWAWCEALNGPES